jgi:PAS domain S-box-containing protein
VTDRPTSERGAKLPLDPGALDLLQELIDGFPQPVLVLDGAHRIALANRTTAGYVGLSPAELRCRPCHTVLHGTATPFPGCPLPEGVRSGRTIEKTLRDDATGRWYSSFVGPLDLKSLDGEALYLHMLEDVTELCEGREGFRREARLNAVLAKLLALSAEHGSFEDLLARALKLLHEVEGLVLEKKGAILLLDESGQELAMIASTGLGLPVLQACERVPLGWCLCGRAAAEGRIHHAAELDHRHDVSFPGIQPHGHYCVPIRSRGETLGVLNLYLRTGHQDDERERELLQSIADGLGGIVDRKLAQRSLEESDERFRVMANATLDGVLLLDEEGEVLFSNDAAEAILGCSPIGEGAPSLAALLPPDQNPTLWCSASQSSPIAGLLRTGRHEVVATRANGRRFPAVLSVGALRLRGRPHLVVVLNDASEQEQLRGAIVRSDRLATIGTTMAGVVHELNNPLAYVSLNLGFFQSELERLIADPRLDPTQVRGALTDLRITLSDSITGAERMRSILDDVRNLSRVGETSRQQIELAEVVNAALTLANSQLKYEATISADLGESLGVVGNVGQLGQVLLNLLLNAGQALVEHEVADPRIEIHGFRGAHGIIVEVQDNGPGVPEAVRDRLFEAFFTTRSESGGTGLGLSISRDIIQAHGGSLTLVETDRGGACFRILLPSA